MASEIVIRYTRAAVIEKLQEMADRQREIAGEGDPHRSPKVAAALGQCMAFEIAKDMVADIVTLEDSL